MKNTSISLSLKVASAVFLILVGSSVSKAQLVDIATDLTDPSNLKDHEPSIAVNPLNPREIVVTTFSEGWGPGELAPIWRSTDGGATWAKIFILPQPDELSRGICDQKPSFDGSGNLHIAILACDVPEPSCLIFRQAGAAGTALTFGERYGDDQPHLDFDIGAGSAFLGRLYSPWLNFTAASARSTVARSTDGGDDVTNVGAGDNSTFRNRTTRVAVARDGKVYIIYKTHQLASPAAGSNFEDSHFRVNRSDDGGVTWDAIGAAGVSVHGADAVQTWFTQQFGNPARGRTSRARSSDAWIAVDPGDGDVYAAFCDRDASGFGQIFVARSTDGGVTWTNTRVTDGTHHSAFPEIAVATNGTVGVLYVDFDDSGRETIFRHRFARSFNNGATWSHENLQSMNPGPIANAVGTSLWGDYEGLTVHGNTFFGVFTGQSIGRTTLQLDPIFFTRTAVRFINICQLRPASCVVPKRFDRNLLVLECPSRDCLVVDPLPQNCLMKFECPGCSPRGLCPPYYNLFFDGLDDWTITVFDPNGKPVRVPQLKTQTGIVISFRPEKRFFENGKIGGYSLVFRMGRKGKVGQEYRIRTRLEASDKPFKP